MAETKKILFDYACSHTFREYEAELNGLPTIPDSESEPSTCIPLNDCDKSLLRMLAHLLNINVEPEPYHDTQKHELKGVPL